jgi:hypothetical protein
MASRSRLPARQEQPLRQRNTKRLAYLREVDHRCSPELENFAREAPIPQIRGV